MYNLNRYIFQQNLGQRYASEFQQYMIHVLYGDILIGDDIVQNYQEEQ